MKYHEKCAFCDKQGELHPIQLGWGEVSSHLACYEFYLDKRDEVFRGSCQLQIRDDKKFPQRSDFRCMKCSLEFHYQWYECTSCEWRYADTNNGRNYGSVSYTQEPLCRHSFIKTAGQGECPKCGSLYVEWLNYVPPRYYWVSKRKL